jgi:CheY-like chemotaxis protein
MTENVKTANKFMLIGEDDIDDKEILEEIFESIDLSIQLEFINSGEKLVNYLEVVEEDKLPCLIILDYNMPDLNGAEILECLQENERVKSIPKMIWSTSNAPAYKNRCLELGACDYLVKPSRIKDLENMLRHMLSYCAL